MLMLCVLQLGEESGKFSSTAVASSTTDNTDMQAHSVTSLDDDTSHVSHRTRSREISSSTTTATATTTISCEGESTSPDPHPIIILQEAPVVCHPGELEMVVPPPSVPRPQRTLNPYNPRHQRALRRQNTDDDLPPIVLTPETLENIVIHNAPSMPGVTEEEEGAGHRPSSPATNSTTMGYANPKSGPSTTTQ